MKIYIYTLTLMILTIFVAAEDKNETSEVIKKSKRGKIKITKNYQWYSNASGLADKRYRGSWSFREVKTGKSILAKLYRRSFLVDSFDGQSYRELAFQLPSNVKVGEIIELKIIPKNRKTEKRGEFSNVGVMQDGEIVGLAFGNPRSGNMNSIKIAKVKVISKNDSQVTLHLRLKASVEEMRDFDIDETFIVNINKTINPSNQPEVKH